MVENKLNLSQRILWLSGGVLLGMAIVKLSQGRSPERTASKPIRAMDNLIPKDGIPKEMILTKDTPGVYFGRRFDKNDCSVGKPLSEDGHVLVIGQSGCGKTAGIVNPTIEAGGGFGVYFDVKGELFGHWQHVHGGSGRKCLYFNPYDEERCNCYYDPYAPLRHDTENLVDHAVQLARTIIPEKLSDYNKIWSDSAEKFVTAAIIYFCHQELSFSETIQQINLQSVSDLIDSIKKSDDLCAQIFVSKFSDMETRTIAGIGMELITHLSAFVTSSAIYNAFTSSDGKELLDWELLNAGDEVDVILGFPEDKLDAARPLFRVIVNQLIESLERRKTRSYDEVELPPVLIVADEFPRLGSVPALKNGLMTLRSRGVTMVLLIQSLASLDTVYGETVAREICENCSYKVILGSTDVRSQEYVANLIGTTVVRRMSASESTSVSLPLSLGLNKSRSFFEDRQRLIQPHALRTLRDVIVVAPQGVFQLEKNLVYMEGRVWPREADAASAEQTIPIQKGDVSDVKRS